MPKTWTQKLNQAKKPKLEVLGKPFAGVPAGATLFVATPQLVKAFMEAVPPGQKSDMSALRASFARERGASATCPVSSAIFARVVAEAAWEEIRAGKDPGQVTPFWRTIEPDSPIARKLACGPEFIRAMRKKEGIA